MPSSQPPKQKNESEETEIEHDEATWPLSKGSDEPVSESKLSKPVIGDFLNDRWQLEKEIGNGTFAFVMLVHDKKENVNCVMKIQKGASTKPAIVNEMTVLTVLKEKNIRDGFATLVDSFQHNDIWNCIVLTNEGIPLYSLLKKAPTRMKFSDKNVERIGYRIFSLVGTFHKLGFVHRDIHLGNCLVKKRSDGVLSITLIDYGLSKKIDETVESKKMVCPHASLDVCENKKFHVWDDHFSVQICIMQLAGYSHIFDGAKDDKDLVARKKEFDLRPMNAFEEENEWLGELYKLIKRCKNQKVSPHKSVMEFFNKRHIDNIEYKNEGDSFIIL